MTMLIVAVIMAAIIFALIMWYTGYKEVSACIAGVFILIAIMYGAMIWYPKFLCEQRVEPTGYECNWTFFAGCLIKVNGQWIPYDKWRVIE